MNKNNIIKSDRPKFLWMEQITPRKLLKIQFIDSENSDKTLRAKIHKMKKIFLRLSSD